MKTNSGKFIAAFLTFAASGALAHTGVQDRGRTAHSAATAINLPVAPQVIEHHRQNIAPDACSSSGAINQPLCPTYAALSPAGKPVRVIKIYNVANVTVCEPGPGSQCRTAR